MPVAKKNAKINKVSARDEETDEEDDDTSNVYVSEETDESDTEDDSEEESAATSAKPRKPRAPNGPPIPWDQNLETILGRTMLKIKSGKLRGALTPRMVLEHLKGHDAFKEFSDRLTPSGLISRVKGMNAALTAEGYPALPEFQIRQKRNVKALGAALSADEDEE